MSMSMGGGPSVKAEPNVTPMIDVMLVLLIIFMVVTPALMAGFNANPPQAVNLKDHPEDENLDQVEIGPEELAVLNSRVKRERPNSPDTPLIR